VLGLDGLWLLWRRLGCGWGGGGGAPSCPPGELTKNNYAHARKTLSNSFRPVLTRLSHPQDWRPVEAATHMNSKHIMYCLCIINPQCTSHILNTIEALWGDQLQIFAHKYVSQQVLAPQNQCKDWLYFVFAFQAVCKFSRGHSTCVQFVSPSSGGMTHATGAWGAQTRIEASSWATISR